MGSILEGKSLWCAHQKHFFLLLGFAFTGQENLVRVPICKGEVLLDSTLNCFIGNEFSWSKPTLSSVQFSSVQLLSHSVMSDSLWPHGLQHTRLPCPSPTPGAWSNSCPSSWWYHPTISSSVVPFSCLQSLPASESFPMSPFFTSGGLSIGDSASASVLSMNIQDHLPLGLTGLISLQSKELSRIFSNTTHSSKSPILQHSAFFIVQLSHPYMTTGKTIALTRQTFVGKVMSLFLNTFLGCHSFSSKKQASFNFMAAVTICSDLGAQENKVPYCFHCFPIYLPWSDGTRCHDLSFLNVAAAAKSLQVCPTLCVEF